ncbi:MAG: hypothetical protein ACLP0J_26155 [Solirubrobacteraceae bacterium]
MLASGPRDAPRRQHTLQATIDWSYQLLTPHEQQLFARLAVFADGFTLTAAEAICDADLDSLQALTDRSLIRVEDGRYTMLETIREYALTRLDQTDQADQLRRRHAEWLVEVLTPKPGSSTTDSHTYASLLDAERDNFRSALEWAADGGIGETVARLAAPLTRWLWIRQGPLNEAARWLDVARERLAEYPVVVQAAVLTAARVVAWKRQEHEEGSAHCEDALAIYRELGDAAGCCGELTGLGHFARERGDLAGTNSARGGARVRARTQRPEFRAVRFGQSRGSRDRGG